MNDRATGSDKGITVLENPINQNNNLDQTYVHLRLAHGHQKRGKDCHEELALSAPSEQ